MGATKVVPKAAKSITPIVHTYMHICSLAHNKSNIFAISTARFSQNYKDILFCNTIIIIAHALTFSGRFPFRDPPSLTQMLFALCFPRGNHSTALNLITSAARCGVCPPFTTPQIGKLDADKTIRQAIYYSRNSLCDKFRELLRLEVLYYRREKVSNCSRF